MNTNQARAPNLNETMDIIVDSDLESIPDNAAKENLNRTHEIIVVDIDESNVDEFKEIDIEKFAQVSTALQNPKRISFLSSNSNIIRPNISLANPKMSIKSTSSSASSSSSSIAMSASKLPSPTKSRIVAQNFEFKKPEIPKLPSPPSKLPTSIPTAQQKTSIPKPGIPRPKPLASSSNSLLNQAKPSLATITNSAKTTDKPLIRVASVSGADFSAASTKENKNSPSNQLKQGIPSLTRPATIQLANKTNSNLKPPSISTANLVSKLKKSPTNMSSPTNPVAPSPTTAIPTKLQYSSEQK